ncbi:hypothetical protein [Coleofasciculus sp. H7-2]|uniref:hypothetical protein n=1 Tax=Coleofasciculus sp. H7-2 TaxID=3351545 RepID=UPI003670FC43
MVFKIFHAKKVNQYKYIPDPNPVFPFCNVPDFLNEPLYECLLKYSETYGDVTLFWIFSQPNILITSPELLEKVLVT